MAFDPRDFLKTPYLSPEDLLEGERRIATIKAAREETFQRSGETQPILEFFELDQMLVLNRTRLRRMVELFGLDTAAWLNQKIALYVSDVTFGGRTVQTIAIGRAPANSAPKKAAPVQDDILFVDEDN